MQINRNLGRWAQPRIATIGFGWPALKRRVDAYLERHGVPRAQAERLSQEIIALCADQAELIGPEHMGQRVGSEARTLLEGWQAERHTSPLAVA